MARHPKIRRAAHYQRRDDPVRVIADKAPPAAAKAIRTAYRHFRDGLDVKSMAINIEGGHLGGVLRSAKIDDLPDLLRAGFAPIASAFRSAAARGSRSIVRKDATQSFQPDDGDSDPYAFDILTPDTVRAVKDLEDALVAELGEEARQTIIDAVTEGLNRGDSAAEIASRIRTVIGLTDRQAMAVDNYRRLLESGDQAALSRSLRDSSYDDLVQMLVDGQGLDAGKIDEIVNAYAERYLDLRAETIARTETIRAANLGIHEAYSQAVDQGLFPKAAVRRYWLIAMDEKTCPICEAIPDLNPDGVGLDEPFKTDDGDVDDPPLHVNCRCNVEYRTDLDMKEDPVEQDAEAA